MSTTFKYPAHRIPYTNSGTTTVASGSVVVMGDMIGVAVADIAAGAEGVVEIDGVHVLPAVNNAAIAQGDQVYWDASAGKITETSTGN
jgi:predicted RecA/RadA family phage recombinase